MISETLAINNACFLHQIKSYDLCSLSLSRNILSWWHNLLICRLALTWVSKCLFTFKCQGMFLNYYREEANTEVMHLCSYNHINILWPFCHTRKTEWFKKLSCQTGSVGSCNVFHILTEAPGSEEDASHRISITFPGNPNNDAACDNAEQSGAHP